MKGLSNCAKLANACKSAREAGRIYELETLAQSAGGAESIIAEAAERAAIRETILEGAKSGRIVIKNPNVQFHIMQEKHGWDKVIKLTGNVEEDFKVVAAFLEENNVASKVNLKIHLKLETQMFITVSEYRTTVNGYELQVFFDSYLDTGESFLKNAWVVTIENSL
jgi:hypothetical protein